MNPSHPEGSLPFDLDALGAVSRRLAEAVFSSLPQLRRHARVVRSGESDGLSLSLVVPSPTGDPDRTLVVWVDEAATPSVGFGPSHAHEHGDEDGIAATVDRATAILLGQVLIIEDVGGAYPGHGSWIDLRDPDALEEELTSPYSPGSALLKSWSGEADRQVSTDSLMR